MEQRPILALALVGCFSKPPFEGSTDASTDALTDALIDAAPDAPPLPVCVQFTGWGPVQTFPAPVSSTDADTSGWISEDRLELMFWSNRTGSSKFYRSRRTSTGAPFGLPEMLDLPPHTNGHLSVSAEGLRIWFDENGGDIYTATRGSTAEEFANPQLVAEVSSVTLIDHGVDVSADGRQMVFMRGSAVTALKTVHLATRADANAVWTAPVEIHDYVGGSGCCPTHTTDPDELIVEDNGTLARMRRSGPPWSMPVTFQLGAGDPYLTRDGRTLVFTQLGNGYDLAYVNRTCMDPLGP